MLGRELRKDTNIEVNVVDITPLLEGKKVGDYTKLGSTYSWGYVETKRGTFFLCDEGVGDNLPMGIKKYEIDIHGYTDTSFTMTPIGKLKVSMDEVKQLPSHKVNLKDFIRKFGSRLDENYYEWKTALEEASTE